MNILPVTHPAFKRFGKVVDGYEFKELLDVLSKTEKPDSGTVYVPGDPALEGLPVCRELQDGMYGGMPIQIGYCNGVNSMLNCLEYHRDSEVNIAADDIVLLLAHMEDLNEKFSLNTSCVQAFLLPAGTAAQLYETSLHYAPARQEGGFRVAVVLPKGTNTQKPDITVKNEEDRLLWARNKWLIAHADSSEAKNGAFVGISGKNINIAEVE